MSTRKYAKNENFWKSKIEYEHPGLTQFLDNKEKSYREIYRQMTTKYWEQDKYFFSAKISFNPLRVVAVVKGFFYNNSFSPMPNVYSFNKGDKIWASIESVKNKSGIVKVVRLFKDKSSAISSLVGGGGFGSYSDEAKFISLLSNEGRAYNDDGLENAIQEVSIL